MNKDFEVLLDKNIPWDLSKIKLLDNMISILFQNPSHPTAIQANQILIQLKEDQDLWLAAVRILETTEDLNTKFFALQILEQTIHSKWKILPEDQKQGIKNNIFTMVIRMGTNLHDKTYQFLLRKANMVLITIVQQEWNTDWKNFISDICNSSQQDQSVCENNLEILRILSEEIYDYSKNRIISSQVKELKETMRNEFSSIYQLCSYVLKGYLENSQKVRISLIETCLNTLLAFLNWIPFDSIFLTDLVDILIQIFETKELKPACLKCFIEIVNFQIEETCSEEEEVKNIEQKLVTLYTNFVYKLEKFIPCEINLEQERLKLIKQRNTSLTHFDSFCQQLAFFLTRFMNIHLHWLMIRANDGTNTDQMITIDHIKKGFQYLVNLSKLPGQTFKICVDFWRELSAKLLTKNSREMNGSINNSLLQNNLNYLTSPNSVFNSSLTQIRCIMISRMPKPIEVLFAIEENGYQGKQHLKNTENDSLYEIMKDLLISLTKLDWEDTKSIMISKLDKQVNNIWMEKNGVLTI